MKIQLEIPDSDIEKDGLHEISIINLIEGGVRYMARVSGNHNVETSPIKFNIVDEDS